MAEKQKQLDEKALDSFNKAKDILLELVKTNPTDKDIMIFLVGSLKELDRMISDHTYRSTTRMDNIIKTGIAFGGVVATALIAIIFKGNSGGGKA